VNQCIATSSETKQRCKQRPMKDRTVCRYHTDQEETLRKLKSRAVSAAQARAKTELSRKYPELYRELYLKFRDELFTERGLVEAE